MIRGPRQAGFLTGYSPRGPPSCVRGPRTNPSATRMNMSRADSFPHLLADVARSLQAEASSKDTMDLAVTLAVEVVDGAQDAAIPLISRSHTVQTPAATNDRAFKVDQIQYELKQGPSLSAIWDEEIVSCPDLEAEDRWGAWAPRTVRRVRSGACSRSGCLPKRTASGRSASTPHSRTPSPESTLTAASPSPRIRQSLWSPHGTTRTWTPHWTPGH